MKKRRERERRGRGGGGGGEMLSAFVTGGCDWTVSNKVN